MVSSWNWKQGKEFQGQATFKGSMLSKLLINLEPETCHISIRKRCQTILRQGGDVAPKDDIQPGIVFFFRHSLNSAALNC